MKIGLNHFPETQFAVDGHTYFYFGGTAYLGMQQHPQFKAKLSEYIQEIGTHWGASRAGNVIVNIYEKTERKLASWAGSERALTLSSGFLSGRLLVDFVMATGRTAFYSPNCHAALLPQGVKRATSWEELEEILTSHLMKKPTSKPVLFTDTIDFHEAPGLVLKQLTAIASKSITLIADDSHGIGILGKHGNGAYQTLIELGFEEVLVCGSMGKALGISAGVVFGSAKTLHQLEKIPLFSGASPASPAAIAALSWAMDNGLYADQLKKLNQNTAYFRNLVKNTPILQPIKDHSVWVFQEDSLARFLQDSGILITHFNYNAAGVATSPSRIVLSAAHTTAQLDILSKTLQTYTTFKIK